MKIRILLVMLALAAAPLTGCIGADDEPVEGSTTDGDNKTGTGDGDVSDSADQFPLPEPKVPLDASVNVSEVWVKPGTTVTITSEAASATSVRYFLEKRVAASADPHAGHDMGGDGGMDHSAHGGGDGGMDMIDTGDIAPGVSAEPFTVENTGWYTFHCHPHPWMKFNVTVVEGAATSGVIDVHAVNGEGDDTFRFYPEDLTVAPGTQIRVHNNGTVVHTVMEEAFRPFLGEGASVDVAVDKVGDWDVVAVATDDGNGHGEARTRLVVDPAKPEETKTWDPFTGEFTLGTPAQPESKKHTFLSEWAMATTTVAWTTAATLPGSPSAVTVTVTAQGAEEPLAQTEEAAAEGELVMENLPAGTYVITITLSEGGLVDYEATVDAVFDLVPPEDYKPSEGGDGHGGHAH